MDLPSRTNYIVFLVINARPIYLFNYISIIKTTAIVCMKKKKAARDMG